MDFFKKKFGDPISQFELLIPFDYNHDLQIDLFAQKITENKEVYHYNKGLTSSNFSKATNKLQPGKTYGVKLIPILKELSGVTNNDCINFLHKKSAILVGCQGLTLMYSLKKEEFPMRKYTFSFDEEQALWKDDRDKRMVPLVLHGSNGGYSFYAQPLPHRLLNDSCLVCFHELTTKK